VQILRADQPHALRKSLWLGGLGVGLFLSILVAHEAAVRLSDRSSRLTLGEDFVPAYAAGTLVRQGRWAQSYSIDSVAEFEHHVVKDADLEPLPVYGPFFNPPFFAALYAPLAALPYRQAAVVWLGINLFLLSASIVLLCRMLPAGCGWKSWGLVPLLIVLPLPFWQAICHQQNTFLSLLLMCVVVTFWRSAATDRRLREIDSVLAGLSAGLLFYKPQLALPVSVVLGLTLGWRALLGLAITGTALLLFTIVAMPGSLEEYLHRMPATVAWMQTALKYNWGRQVTPLGFWRVLLEGHAAGATTPLAKVLAILTNLIAAAALSVVVFHFLRKRQTSTIDPVIAITIIAIPLLVPYFMDYDLLLLAIPAVLTAHRWMQPDFAIGRADRILLGGWIALFVWMYFNPAVAGQTRFNLIVPMIGAISGLSIYRCLDRKLVRLVRMGYDQRHYSVAA
jgi:hypothetical protein